MHHKSTIKYHIQNNQQHIKLRDRPVHYDPEESTPLGFRQLEGTPGAQHKHAIAQNSNTFYPLLTQFNLNNSLLKESTEIDKLELKTNIGFSRE